jgi:hypothetical protein
VLGPTSDRHQRLVILFFFSALSVILREPIEEIDDPTTVAQILWIFSRRKGDRRITLKENPHFYLKIPRKGAESEFDSWQDGKGFHRDPLSQIGPDLEQNGTVYVILDKKCRLYLDVAETRVFGNLCQPHKKIILKGEWVFLSQYLLRANPWLFKIFAEFWIQKTTSVLAPKGSY